MTNLIVELSKYALILLMALYTCMTFISFRMKTRKSSDYMLAEMTFIMLLLQFVAYLVLYLKLGEQEDMIYYYGFQALFMILITILWRLFYKDIHSTLLSNMCMLISIGFIMLTRIDVEQSVRQFKIVIIAMIVSMIVPVVIRKWKACCNFDAVYGILGILMLSACFKCSYLRSQHFLYHCRSYLTAFGICKNIICVLCGGQICKIYRI